MSRTCKIRIQINGGTIKEASTEWGFHLIESDNTIVPPIRDYPIQEYPESANAEIYPHTTLKPFDYKCKLLCLGALTTINQTVKGFYDSLFTITTGQDLRQALPITLYNDYKGVKLTGYVKSVEAGDYYPEISEVEKGAYTFDFILYIADPKTLIAL